MGGAPLGDCRRLPFAPKLFLTYDPRMKRWLAIAEQIAQTRQAIDKLA